ncbi:hypothetical protein Tsubulata_050017 [Turnera subulata]|uniref:Wall-associated receptor kinase galacturonan-binding domain-containing protein n=1 Tax=Turnera subulata TaxID=218843 RepID=A0A9Q0J4W9_9ROSI|nr:hypothetical protein Tsubulata_050017 [Turnera subulata]
MTPPPILHLLLLLFTAVLLLTFPPNAISATTHCPNCGTTPVPYPLSTSPTCGDPHYRIRCNAGKLMFDTVNNSYPITSINPSTQRLVIQPATFLAPNTCVTSDYSGQGVQLNNSLPFNITGSNTVMFFNCSAEILDSPLNCSSTNLCHVYLNNSNSQEEEAACRAAPVCCTFRAGGGATAYMIRVRPGGCGAYTSFVNLDAGRPVGQWPRPGLEIQWAMPQEPLCGSQVDCDEKSTCAADGSGSGVKRCYCNSGLFWDGIRGICANNVTCPSPGGCGGSSNTALIAVYVQRMVEEERLMEAIHPKLKENASNLQLETIKALAFLALNCLEEKRQNRPSMKEVTEEIEYIITVATTKDAYTK